jgi:sugar/nucleoside kinase (ribokinase family)
MPRLGVLGTFVLDTIWTPDDAAAGRPFESWGGLGYSLAAASAARPPGWEIVPVAKVGRDLAHEVHAFMATLPGVTPGPAVQVVPEPNNRVELRYTDATRRGERLTGGVPGWTGDEIAAAAAGLDALCVNFFSGFEMGVEAAERLRAAFPGPLYADLHSLFLGPPGAGPRERRRLPAWERWAACFDAVQLNEEELAMIGGPDEGWAARARRILDAGPGLVLVTRGGDGAAVARRGGFPDDPGAWGGRRTGGGAGETERFAFPAAPAAGDPTGCGDVWGATAFCGLLGGRTLEEAVAGAHAAAVRKLGHRGTGGLRDHLAAGRGRPFLVDPDGC